MQSLEPFPINSVYKIRTWYVDRIQGKRVHARWIRLKGQLQKWFDDKGYGFIKADDGRRLFVHNWDIYGVETIREKQRMEFKIKQTEKGLKAIYVKIIK
jgi:CspA family cold shock protein